VKVNNIERRKANERYYKIYIIFIERKMNRTNQIQDNLGVLDIDADFRDA
jgi:hypothetical protein